MLIGAVDLRRRDAQVEQCSCHRVHSHLLHDSGDCVEPDLSQLHPVAEPLERAGRGRHRVLVPIETEELDVRQRLQEGTGMSSPADRGVDHGAGRDGPEQLDDLVDHHGLVLEPTGHQLVAVLSCSALPATSVRSLVGSPPAGGRSPGFLPE